MSFTSTSTDQESTQNFLKEEKFKLQKRSSSLKENKVIKVIKSGTIFSLKGVKWGYDIHLFSIYGHKEKEILLEP